MSVLNDKQLSIVCFNRLSIACDSRLGAALLRINGTASGQTFILVRPLEEQVGGSFLSPLMRYLNAAEFYVTSGCRKMFETAELPVF